MQVEIPSTDNILSRAEVSANEYTNALTSDPLSTYHKYKRYSRHMLPMPSPFYMLIYSFTLQCVCIYQRIFFGCYCLYKKLSSRKREKGRQRETERQRERLQVHSETQPKLEPGTCPYMHNRSL